MGRLAPSQGIGREYDSASIIDAMLKLETQINALSEGRIAGRYNARTAAPSGAKETFAIGDLIPDSNCAVTSGSVRLGWITTAAGSPGTQQEVWVSTAAPIAGIGPLPYAGSSIPTGWLECDGSAVSRATYSRLFTAISTNWGVGDGSTTFNLPDMRGKSLIGAGTGTVVSSGVNADVDTTADTLTVAANNTKWITGMSVVFSLSSGTITGLTSGNTYFIVRSSSTLVKLASSLANAQNGTVVDMTAKSTPVWTITHTYTARTLAEYGGQETHAMSSVEQLLHLHSVAGDGGGDGGSGLQGTADGGPLGGRNTASTGGNNAMNVMNPFAVTKFIISY